ncbi:hypothetical protein [Deinococcus rufus]|uniref:Uncharacterized protein n=1 Tax=Deinococcus rufus TaxID=2136097 RepID=A0ABV7Z9U6_9DEIO
MDTIPPLLTLQQLRETGPLRQQLILAARHHVGEAGLEQASSLERLLVVCRHQGAVSTALRSLGWALGQMTDGAQEEARAALLEALRFQLQEAEAVEKVLSAALRDITSTPVIFLSAASLTEIEQRARAQMEEAEKLVAQASQHGTTAEEKEALTLVDQGMREALARSAEEEIEGQAAVLSYMIREAATKLAALPTLPNPVLAEMLEDVAVSLRTQAAPHVPMQVHSP